MLTQIKTRKHLEDLITPINERKNGECFQQELIGYNFLRNIWGTYFFDRQNVSAEDKIDHINKIVGMMKAQVKLMINHEENIINHNKCDQSDKNNHQNMLFLQGEHQKTKQALQRSKMRQEEIFNQLLKRQQENKLIQQQNFQLKSKMFELKQAKNKCQQKIIELSNKVYDLQKGYFLNTSGDCFHEDNNNTLDQFSAISFDKQDEREKPRVSLFSRRENISLHLDQTFNDEQLHSEEGEEEEEKEALCQVNINIPTFKKHSLKKSLPIFAKQQSQLSANLIEEMKKMKIKTARIMEIQNDRMSQRQQRRKTFGPLSHRPIQPSFQQQQNQKRRFRRIRC